MSDPTRPDLPVPDPREHLGRAALQGHLSGLAEQDDPPWQDRPPVWEELSDGDREFYMRIGAAAATAERERAERAEAKLDALREVCRRKAEWVDLYCPPLGGSAEPLVKVSEILAVIGSGGASVFSAACTGPDCGERFADSETGEYEVTSRERMNRLLDADGWQADPVLCPGCQPEETSP